MVMNPRTHPRGTAPDFTLPAPNPNPTRMTNALWWLVCMCEALEPSSQNGGTFANKAGYHNAGENLRDHGAGNAKTDHSIRRAPDRRGPWWKQFSAGRDWTFPDAQRGDYSTINKYTKRMINAMRDPDDLRPDDVFAYVLGQIDGDTVVEGWNEYTNEPETGDSSHLWHIHESWRRDIVGNFWAMWKALTIYMGWTYAEWLVSTTSPDKEEKELTMGALEEFFASIGRAVDGTGSEQDRNNRNNFAKALRFTAGLNGTEQTAENLPLGDRGLLERIANATEAQAIRSAR